MQSDNTKQEILNLVEKYYNEKQNEIILNNKINYAGRVYNHKEIQNLVESALEFQLTGGRWIDEFEKKFAEFLDVKYCLAVNSGSSANLLAFMALTSPLLSDRRIERGDEVITVACAFPTTVSPIIQYGAIPVFVDVDLETVNMDVTQLEQTLSEKTKAIMVAHTLGNPFNIKVVKQFCDDNNLFLIEDNCDALGSKYNNQYTGTFGDIGTSSFYPPHHITMGEGGAVYTNNKLLYKILLSMRDWGRDCSCPSGIDNKCGKRFIGQFGNLPKGFDHKYIYSHLGMNLKLTEMQASIGVAQLEKLSEFIKKRKENWNILYEELKDLQDCIILPQAAKNSDPSWFGFLMIIKESDKYSRNDIVWFLEKNNIQTRMLFSGNIVKQPLFDNLEIDWDYKVIGNLKNTDIIMNNAFWIGVYPGMTEDKLNYMINKIKEYFV